MRKNSKRKPTNTTDRKSTQSVFIEMIKQQRIRIISGVLLALLSIYIFISMVGFFFAGGIDQSLVDAPMHKIIVNPDIVAYNSIGKLGAWYAIV